MNAMREPLENPLARPSIDRLMMKESVHLQRLVVPGSGYLTKSTMESSWKPVAN